MQVPTLHRPTHGRRRATAILPAIAISAAALAGAPIATARPTWLPARTLATDEMIATYTRMAVGPDGTANGFWIGWSDDTTQLYSSSRPPAQPWGANRIMSSPDGAEPDRPGVAMAPDGTVTAAWNSGAPTYPIRSAIRDPTGEWHPVETLPGSEPVFDGPVLGSDGTGRVTAAWSVERDPRPAVSVSTRATDGSWSSDETISTPEPWGTKAQIGVAHDGTATAVWLSSPDADIRVSTRPPGGTWSTPETLDSDGFGPQIAVSPNGTVTTAWIKLTPGDKGVRVVTRPPGGTWTAPRALSTNVISGVLAVAADDQAATVAWPGLADGGAPAVEAAIRSNGEWGPVTTIADDLIMITSIRAAASGHGNSMVSWVGPSEQGWFGGVRGHLHGRGWTQVHPLSRTHAFNESADVAFSPAGDATVIWSTASVDDERDVYRIRTTTLDVSGPVLHELEVPATATVGEPVSVSVDPIDVWSAVGATEWDFGDGTVATGTHATHTYADPGTYIVTIVSRDEHGNRTTKTRRITINGAALPSPAPDPGPEELPSPDPGYPPQDCDARFISMTRLEARGTTRRPVTRMTFRTAPSLAGQTARVLRRTPDAKGRFRRERTVGTTTIRPDGTATATVRAPVGARTRARARYRLATATVSSGSHHATRRARFTRRRALADGRVVVEGRVARIHRPTKLTVNALRICGGTERTYSTIRTDRSGRFRTTLAPPSGASSVTLYRVRLRMRTFTLPTVVTGR